MGFTQETLAEHLGLERSTVGRWERGTGTPQPWNQPDLAKALDVSRDALADLLDPDPVVSRPSRMEAFDGAGSVVSEFNWSDRHPAGSASVLDPPWTITGTTRVLHQVAGGPMDRREFLTITGGALTGLVGQWNSALANAPLPAALTEPGHDRLTPDVLDRLDHRLADLRRLDDALGGRDLCQLAVAEFRYLTHLADHATYSGATGQRLFSLITAAARLCGWLHFDAAQDASAQYYYVAALRSSALANDALAGAHVLSCMCYQATLAGHHREALNLMDAAEEQTRHLATPRLKALLTSNKAHAHAKAGDAAACGHALNEAEHWLDTAKPGTEEPDWIYFYDEADFFGHAAVCWADLEQPAKARPHIDSALGTRSTGYVRDRAVYHVRSAETHLHADDLEPACNNLRTAAELVSQTGSVRTIDMIRSTRRTMSRYDQEPRVKQLDRQLITLFT
ncbi:hypothetical protein ALI144C_52520 [Actinosynnema sp. ALI-1.44]|nr:hypothetical protein ALI144C_52520 [Actinosynnema sp. ALI-1.44]